MGDILPRSEEEFARREDIYSTYGETPKRIQLPGKLELIQMREKTETTPGFTLFSPQVETLLRENKKKRAHIFIFAARRGLAPLVACVDCGYVFRSPQSGAPYSLIRTVKNGTEERWFVCSTSGERVRASDTCPTCGSWRLKERGIGIQFIHDELRKLLPNSPIILFDHTSATTYKKACFLRDTFYNTKGAIMLGTHMAIPYLTKEIDASVIANVDALLTTPTWRLDEENLALLLRLREVTKASVMVQMRAQEIDLVGYAKNAEVERFYDDELELRKTFNYPPFSTFIHLTWQGSPESVRETKNHIETLFKEFKISFYPSPLSPKDSQIEHGLIRANRGSWPDAKIILALKALPPTVRIIINPDRIV
jgi:primosomal protein N' (replication factor Y)